MITWSACEFRRQRESFRRTTPLFGTRTASMSARFSLLLVSFPLRLLVSFPLRDCYSAMCSFVHCLSLLTYKAGVADKEPWLGVTDINGIMNTMFTFLPPSSILISTAPPAHSQGFISSDERVLLSPVPASSFALHTERRSHPSRDSRMCQRKTVYWMVCITPSSPLTSPLFPSLPPLQTLR